MIESPRPVYRLELFATGASRLPSAVRARSALRNNALSRASGSRRRERDSRTSRSCRILRSISLLRGRTPFPFARTENKIAPRSRSRSRRDRESPRATGRSLNARRAPRACSYGNFTARCRLITCRQFCRRRRHCRETRRGVGGSARTRAAGSPRDVFLRRDIFRCRRGMRALAFPLALPSSWVPSTKIPVVEPRRDGNQRGCILHELL